MKCSFWDAKVSGFHLTFAKKASIIAVSWTK